MVERIERVNKIKAIDYDISRPFERREDYENPRRGKGSFKHMLHSAMKQENPADAESLPEAYTLELSRATQSLFYQNLVNLKHLEGKVDGER